MGLHQSASRPFNRRGTVTTLQTQSLAHQAGKQRERIAHILQCYVRKVLAKGQVRRMQAQVERRLLEEAATIQIQQQFRRFLSRLEFLRRRRLTELLVQQTLPLGVDETE